MGDWESIFKDKGRFFYESHKDMQMFSALLKKRSAKRVLDLGCGSGRHSVFFAKQGFEVYGMDNSKTGLVLAKKWLRELALEAKLKNSSCYKRFPYRDNFFDAVVSVQVIHHAKLNDINFCISEIERVLKPEGIVFVSVPKTMNNKFHPKVKVIGSRTFVPLSGDEKGVPHYLFNKALLRKSFENFKELSFYEDSHAHYCFIGEFKRI